MCLDRACKIRPLPESLDLVGQGQLQVMGDAQGGWSIGSCCVFSKAFLLEQERSSRR